MDGKESFNNIITEVWPGWISARRHEEEARDMMLSIQDMASELSFALHDYSKMPGVQMNEWDTVEVSIKTNRIATEEGAKKAETGYEGGDWDCYIASGKDVVLYTWYDNEFGYTKQVIRLAKLIAKVRRLTYY